jgi:hypothetical protein
MPIRNVSDVDGSCRRSTIEVFSPRRFAPIGRRAAKRQRESSEVTMKIEITYCGR